jgi:glycosyltransferase involved in cell wall biosynthesis
MIVNLTVVIPCYQGEARLKKSLQHLLRCDPLPQELIIHCDGGWTLSEEIELPEGMVVRVLSSTEHVGPGGGRGRGIKEAQHEIVASFDDDSWPLDADYFAHAVQVMEAFPKAVVMSPAVFVEETPVAPVLSEVNEVRCFEGSASITRRSLYLQLPGYLPVPQAYGIEEADIALQAHAADMLILACPWMRAWHDRPQADHLHAELSWIKNEVLLGYLRFPVAAQPWAWWRAVRRAWRQVHALGWSKCLRALTESLSLCASFSSLQGRCSWSGLMKHQRQQRVRWEIRTMGQGIEVERDSASRRILLAQYTNPSVYPPLEHITKLLSRRGWQVRCLGIHGRSGFVLDWPVRDRVRIQRMPLCEPGLRQKLHYFTFMLWVVWVARRWKPEWVYLSDQLSTPLCWWLRKFTSAKLVYHEHDSPPREGYAKGWFIEQVLRCRLHAARECEVLVLPQEQRLADLVSKSGRVAEGAFTVWNCPSLDEVGDARDVIHEGATLQVIYHGSIGPSGYPEWVLDAVATAKPTVNMTLVGYELPGSYGWTEKLRRRAEGLDYGKHFRLEAAMPRWKLLSYCRNKDVGLGVLCIDETNINLRHLAGASNKPFDYLAQGVVPVVADREEWQRLMVKRGCAVAARADSPEALSQALQNLGADPIKLRQMGELGRQLVLAEWNYEKQFAGVLCVLEGTRVKTSSTNSTYS